MTDLTKLAAAASGSSPVSTKEMRSLLSKDALYCGSVLFRMMTPGHGQLTFQMVESRPTARTQAALDEIVAAGYATREPFNRFGGVTYKPLVAFPGNVKAPVGKWNITEPISRP